MLIASERQRLNVTKMKCLRSICIEKKIDRVRNTINRRRCRNKLSLFKRADKKVLRLFGHLKKISDIRIVKKVYKIRMDSVRRVGRSQKVVRRLRLRLRLVLLGGG